MSAAMDDFSQCLVANTRMAARAVTRRYDGYLRPHGVTATQFSLLGAIQMMPDATVSEIADDRGFERTTLTRNLDKLAAMGLVSAAHAGHGNGRISKLTRQGEDLVEKLVPLWRQAQKEMREALSPKTFDDSLKTLQRLAKA